jgi:hypothetical protein
MGWGGEVSQSNFLNRGVKCPRVKVSAKKWPRMKYLRGELSVNRSGAHLVQQTGTKY